MNKNKKLEIWVENQDGSVVLVIVQVDTPGWVFSVIQGDLGTQVEDAVKACDGKWNRSQPPATRAERVLTSVLTTVNNWCTDPGRYWESITGETFGTDRNIGIDVEFAE